MGVQDCLNWLSELTVEELAELFVATNCHGICNDPYDCPVNNYIQDHTGSNTATAPWVVYDHSENFKEYRVPPNVRKFIMLFDAGTFPALKKV